MKTINNFLLERLVISKNKRDSKNYTFNDSTSLFKKYNEQNHKPFNLEESEVAKTIKEKYNFVVSHLNPAYIGVYHPYISMQYSENWAHHPKIILEYINDKYDNRVEYDDIINENNFMYIFGGGASEMFSNMRDFDKEMAQDYLNLLCNELYYEIN
jgi:hypothetical protein